MIIYKDILSGDELASDVYDIITPEDGGKCLWEINGVMVKPGQESFVLEGANASAEGEDADEGDAEVDNTPILNLARDFRYQKIDSGLSVKDYQSEAKKFLKNVMTKMKEKGRSEEEIAEFKGGAAVALKKIAKNWSDYDIYIGESSELDGMGNFQYVLVNFREDGLTPFVTLWKHGLEEYKV